MHSLFTKVSLRRAALPLEVQGAFRPLNQSTATTPRCRSSHAGRPTSTAFEAMSATINLSGVRHRQALSSTTRAIVAAITRKSHLANDAGILHADACSGYGKLYEPGRAPGAIPEAACGTQVRRKFFVLADGAGARAGSRRARRARCYRPSAVRPCRGLTPCSTSNAISTATRSRRGRLPGRLCRCRWWLTALVAWRAAHEASARPRHHQSHRLPTQALSGVHAVPRRWPDLHQQQRRRTRSAQHRRGPKSWLFCGSNRGGQRVQHIDSSVRLTRVRAGR